MPVIRVQRPTAPRPLHESLGNARVTVNTRYLSVDGSPVLPVSGEIHYSRVPREFWNEMLLRARAGGLTHVATYAIWNHHEGSHGELSFDGGLDVGAFLRTAVGHGLGVILRVGPYVHSEVRHGGLPDRIADGPWQVRTNDPAYLTEVARWYRALAHQVRGIELFGLQVDNELHDRPEHLRELRRIAQRCGMEAPIWTATAWGAAQLPADVLPVYGGYADSFWIEAEDLCDHRSLTNFYPSHIRDDDGIGADHREAPKVPDLPAGSTDHPFATCELGGGMVSAYHRRPLVGARDVEALGLAKLASGSVWQGWYMYADGRNPRRSLQESHATGSPNDFMELGYDFGAALTLDAVPSETWYRLRRQHLFLAEWGPQMAVMPAALPDDAAEPHDLSRLRWSVRSDGQRGFLFVVNHQPSAALPSHDDVTFQVELEEGAVTFPSLCVPGGAVFVFPFNLQVGGVELTWLTAQPLSILEWRGLPLLAASAIDGIPAGFSTSVAATPLRIEGPGQWWCLEAGGEPQARVVILSDEEGLRLGAGLELAEQGFLRSAPEPVRVTELTWTQVAPAEAAPPPTSAPNGRASVPTDWSGAAQFDLELPEGDGTLSLEWVGDIARAWDGQRLVSDAIHNGRAWRISAPERAGASRLRLEILPLHREAAVHVGAGRPVGADVVSARIEPRQRPVWGLGNPT